MRVSRFQKMCKDCQIITKKFTVADMTVVFTLQARKKNPGPETAQKRKALGAKALTFTDFLEVLRRIASRIFPIQEDHRELESFRRLLLEKILPLASRLHPFDISPYQTEEVSNFLGYGVTDRNGKTFYNDGIFTEGLRNIFNWYSTKYTQRHAIEVATEIAQHSKRLGEDLIRRPKKTKKVLGVTGFPEIIKFFEDFGLFSQEMTTFKAADVYLASTPGRTENDLDAVPCLNEVGFFEMLLRIAVVSFSSGVCSSGIVTPEDELKTLLLHMYKAVNHPRKAKHALSQCAGMTYDAVGSKGGDLNIHGSAKFNKVFFDVWKDDGYPDYVLLHVTPTKRTEFAQTEGTKQAKDMVKRYSVAGKRSTLSFWSEELDKDMPEPHDSRIVLKVSDLRQLFQKNKKLEAILSQEIKKIQGPSYM